MKSYSDYRDQHTLDMNGMDMACALGKELVASTPTQDRNKIQPDSDKGMGQDWSESLSHRKST